jgi:indolepyruvate ferredoxin oxidoreductase beta subunit
MKQYNLIIAGVGGQGVILAGNIIGEAALAAGSDGKKTDTIGMAQRGGSVISHLRLAHKVFSPIIKRGEADILIALEKLEAARWSHYLRSGGIAIVNNQALPPLSVSLGSEDYPDDKEIIGLIKKRTKNVYLVEGTGHARELGNIKTLNIFMLGCLSPFVAIKVTIWQNCIAQNLPSRLAKLNIIAFDKGRREMEDMLNKKSGSNNV